MGIFKKEKTKQKTMLYLVVKVNGNFKARYTLEADALRGVCDNTDGYEISDNGATFTIDIPVVVV